MPRYRVSRRAKDDLRQIGLYTQRESGKAKRRKYLSGFSDKFFFLPRTLLLQPNDKNSFPLSVFISMKVI